jgi:type VI protein secretion system component Hcp
MSDEIKKQAEEITDVHLTASELEQVAGGKVSFQEVHFTHPVDKSSPVLMNPSEPTTPPAK